MKELTDIVKAASVAYRGAIEPMEITPIGHDKGIAAAVAAVAPLVLGELSADEVRESDCGGTLWRELDYARAKRLFAARLARLTAKPDPAVEAVRAILNEFKSGEIGAGDFMSETVTRIVAAVDAARGKP